MGLLDWIKRPMRGEEPVQPEPPPPRWCETRKGNPISMEYARNWKPSWSGKDPQIRHHVGRSIEGFHGGLEISYGGRLGALQWSNARPDASRAEKAALGMERAWEKNNRELVKSLDREFKVLSLRERIRAHVWER
jgi:hypothetical protein